MADVGGTGDIIGVDLTLDDEATNSLPDSTLLNAGTYKPTKGGTGTDNFSGSGASAPFGGSLAVFDGSVPNGDWKLYVVDDTSSGIGKIANGWSIEISTDNDPPEITTVDGGAAEEGSPATITVTATDAQNDPLTYSFDCNNDGDYDDPNDVIGQTNNAGQCIFADEGAYTVGVKVSDGKTNGTDTDTATVNIANVAPTISNIENQSISENGDTGELSFTVSDAGNDPVAITKHSSDTALVPNENIVVSETVASHTVVATPGANKNGEATIKLTADDGDGGIASDSFVVTVRPVNQKPTVGPVSSDAVNEDGDEVEIDLREFVSDIETSDDDLSYDIEAVTLAQGAFTQVEDEGTPVPGVLIFDPARDYNTGDSTLDLEYTATDRGDPTRCGDTDPENNLDGCDSSRKSDSSTISITVNPTNDAPLATNDGPITLSEDGFTEIDVLANDSDVDNQPEDLEVVEAGISDPENGTATLIASGDSKGEVLYEPDEDYNGPDSFTYRVSDGTNESENFATVSINVVTVNDAPGFTAAGDENVLEDSKFPNEVTQDDRKHEVGGWISAFDPDATGAEDSESEQRVENYIVTDENGGSLDDPLFTEQPAVANDGTLTYTLAENANGSARFAVTAKDNGPEDGENVNTSQAQTFTITVNSVNDEPTLTLMDDPDQKIEEDSTGPDDEADSREHTVPGFATGSPGGGADEIGQNVAFEVVIVDDDGATIPGGSPLFAEQPNISEDGVLAYKLAENANGTATVAVRLVDDGAGGVDGEPDEDGSDNASDTQTFAITVNAVNDPPLANDAARTVNEDGFLSVNVFDEDISDSDDRKIASDIERDRGEAGATLSVADATQGKHGSVSCDPNGTCTYTPGPDFNGEDEFEYTVRDSNAGETSGKISVTVIPVPDDPVANDDPEAEDTLETDENTPLDINVLANDTDADNDELSVHSVDAGTSEGEVAVNGDGTLAFTPDEGFVGTTTFSYRAMDSRATSATLPDDDASDGVSNEATVTVTVNGASDTAPVGTPDEYSVDEDETLTADDAAGTGENPNDPGNDGVLANDTGGASITVADADPGAPGIQPESGPDHGSLELDADGTFTYTPDEHYNGPDSFTYRAEDATLTSEITTASITVSAVNDEPAAADDATSTPENTPLVFPVSDLLANDAPAPEGATDETGQRLTVTDVDGEENGTATLSNGEVTFTPAPNFRGVASFRYTVCDDGTPSACSVMEATVNVTVSAVNSAPSAGNISLTMAEDEASTSVDLSEHASDDETADGDLAFAIAQGPAAAQGTATLDGATLTFTPTANFNGPVNLRYSVTDTGDGNDAPKSAEAALNIMVTPVNDVPTASDIVVTVREDGTKNIDVLSRAADEDGDELTVAAISRPGKGIARASDDGTIVYAPRKNLNGDDSFTYTVSDGEAESAPATVNIEITAVNDAPKAVNDTVRTRVNRAVNINVLANDTDPDGDALSSALVRQPARGSVVRNPNDTFKYTPPRDFVGTTSFKYRVSDGNGGTDTATVRVTVS